MTAKELTTNSLLEAIHTGHLNTVIIALDEGDDVELPDIHGYAGLPLRTACFEGNLAIVRELLVRGANPNAVASDGPGAPLRLALRRNHQDIVALLLEQGAEIPEGIAIAPEVFDMPGEHSGGDAATASLADGKPDNLIEYTPSEIPLPTEEPDSLENFGTATNALSWELYLQEENEAHNASPSATDKR